MVNEIIVKEDGKYAISENVSKQIAEFEREIKAAKAKEEKLKDMILKEMEDKKILAIENDDLKITYVSETYRTTFDSSKFKEEHLDLYQDYLKDTYVKSSIRITTKEKQDE